VTSLAAVPWRRAGRAHPGRVTMTWITWRQHRMALTGAVILLAACTLALTATGLRLQSAHDALTRAHCPASDFNVSSRCGALWGSYYHAGYPLTGSVQSVTIVLGVVPLLIGVFVAAPLLAREYEAGTFQFAWTQAAGPTRWVSVKLALLGVTLTAAGAAFGALASWWLSVVAPVSGASRWQPGEFGSTPLTFAAWMLLAFAAGAFAGALIRRTVAAMAATAACAAAVFLVAYKRLDPWLVSVGPVVRRVSVLNMMPYQLGSRPPTFVAGTAVVVSAPPGSWPLRAWLAGPHGHPLGAFGPQRFASLDPPAQNRWLAAHHATLWASYQPSGRFWAFQSAEAGAAVLLALLLAAGTVWLVRRRSA
jgi:uncharacterized protein (TIGR03382 family)